MFWSEVHMTAQFQNTFKVKETNPTNVLKWGAHEYPVSKYIQGEWNIQFQP